MSTILLFCALGLGADTSTTATTAANAPAAGIERPFHEIQQAMSAALRTEAAAKNLSQRGSAIRQLCALHREIVSDSRYVTSDKLKEYRAKVWSRLQHTRTELKQQIARQAGRPPLDATSEDAASQAADSLAASLSLADYSVGGPGYLLARGGGAFPADNGQDLVDLITRTINPQFWDVNGGPGAIVYYAPLHCLVVTATSEIHGKIGGVVGGIRAAGK